MEEEQQIADAEEAEVEEAEWSGVENFEVAEAAEFRRRSTVSGEAEVHVEMAVSSCFSSVEPEVVMTL